MRDGEGRMSVERKEGGNSNETKKKEHVTRHQNLEEHLCSVRTEV